MENKDKIVALIWNDHPIMTRELCTATGIEKTYCYGCRQQLGYRKVRTLGVLKMLTV